MKNDDLIETDEEADRLDVAQRSFAKKNISLVVL